ncbi:hypothetical protein [Bradyrhizobium sp. Ash2021]|uniref:hypothetical protein n=1 Tax=Bradyrhizobium sp. Ash2021 TaxID=2954771 RepID=UPI002816228E|nr:hypothetical protein [Bradyrhizobium sp. Ash2021]WMT74259.1 hypothetical protein NL528_41260 [Bradyrhizobium sp. Ash2021]
MAENDLPKRFANAEPGAILIGPVREFCRKWQNLTEVTVPGSHCIHEDSGPAVARWMKAHAIGPANQMRHRGSDSAATGKHSANTPGDYCRPWLTFR